MNVDDVVAEKIAAARARAEASKRRRAALEAARQRGLAHRHAAKLRNLRRAEGRAGMGQPPTSGPDRGDTPTDHDLHAPESNADVTETVTTVGQSTTVAADSLSAADDDVVVEVTEAEFHASARTALARLGLTYAQLEDQARRRNFTSAQAQSLWVSIGGAVNTELLEEQ